MAWATEKDGKFLRTPTGMNEKVERPGYSDYFRRELIRQTGDKFVYPEE